MMQDTRFLSLWFVAARAGCIQPINRGIAQDVRDTSPNGLSDQGRHPPAAPSPPTDSIQGKSGPTGQRHLQGMPVPGAPEDTYLRPQDTYPHHRIPTPPSPGVSGAWGSHLAPGGPLLVRWQSAASGTLIITLPTTPGVSFCFVLMTGCFDPFPCQNSELKAPLRAG